MEEDKEEFSARFLFSAGHPGLLNHNKVNLEETEGSGDVIHLTLQNLELLFLPPQEKGGVTRLQLAGCQKLHSLPLQN